VFTEAERDDVRDRLLALAEADPAITGAAFTGSHAAGDADRWSDIDLVLAVDGPLDAVLEAWTHRLYRDLAAVHHWDLRSGSAVYRVFLLPGWLEVDLGFTPAADFGPRGPRWRLVFGSAVPAPTASPAGDDLTGLAWHHAWHARVCVERGRWWQAEYWISGVRDHVIAMACRRLGLPAAYGKGAHLLPDDLTVPLEAALVRGLAEAELCRALAAAVTALRAELGRADPDLAARLDPMLAELT
jgi:Nucleotidyltransferase domain